MMTLDHALQILSQHKSQLCSKYPIKRMAVFGSFSRNENSQESDLDIAVEFDGPIGLRFIQLAEELEQQLKVKVDLVSFKGIKKKYLDAITPDFKDV
jgi:predicted nucleotidyltransferase